MVTLLLYGGVVTYSEYHTLYIIMYGSLLKVELRVDGALSLLETCTLNLIIYNNEVRE